MKRRNGLIIILLLPLMVLSILAFQVRGRRSLDATPSPTPTYDPLVEPPLPQNPTSLELGENLYWHWCMPCHGDRAQGLTDEFRMIWEPDHQDCWGRGCHGGLPRDEGFPIPTVVPALAGSDQLEKFSSAGQLTDFLKATHPPQSPGILSNEQYHAIAIYVFSLNERMIGSPSPVASRVMAEQISPAAGILVGAILPLAMIFAWALTKKDRKPGP
jgi:mono/diheme cytochrome c family protein